VYSQATALCFVCSDIRTDVWWRFLCLFPSYKILGH
jgi:hypothetical protein